jgi:hypothetical protein
MTKTRDRLLSALDQLAARSRTTDDASNGTVAALIEAIDAWVGEHAVEHNQSSRFTSVDDPRIGAAATRMTATPSPM